MRGDPGGLGGLGEIRSTWAEARRVWGGLEVLCEVELGASLVTAVHGLGESTFGDEAVEDDGVDEDDEDLDDDFDDGADKTPVLETAEEGVVDLVVEELLPQVLVAGPTPHVLAAAVGFGGLVDGRGDDPHDHAQEKETDGEECAVEGHLLGAFMAAPEVAPEDHYTGEEGDAGDNQEEVLGPWVCAFCPGREVIARRERFCCVEDGQGGCQDCKDDETAAKIDETEEDFGYPDTQFNFLWDEVSSALVYSRVLCILTTSLAFSLSASCSCFSTKNSSRNVGLRGFNVRPGVPGTFIALLRGEPGGGW